MTNFVSTAGLSCVRVLRGRHQDLGGQWLRAEPASATRRWAALRATVMKPVTFKQQETWEIYGKSLWEMGNL
jgi:hypothetical protein